MSERAEQDLNVRLIVLVGLAGALLVFVVIVALEAWFYSLEDAQVYRKVIEPSPEPLARAMADQQIQISSYRVIDPARNVIAIPIERAMEIVAREEAAAAATRPAATRRSHER